jgi:hypothetical protein
VKPKRYCVQLSDGRWVKRTSHFGYSHGSVVLTSDPEERRWWSRERDARSASRALNGRIESRSKWNIPGLIEIELKRLGLTAIHVPDDVST